MPKPVTLYDPFVAFRADMSDPDITEMQIPPHFTNIQHALQMARQFLTVQDTLNRQIILITDGMPTAHFEGKMLYLLYPPDRMTETGNAASPIASGSLAFETMSRGCWQRSTASSIPRGTRRTAWRCTRRCAAACRRS